MSKVALLVKWSDMAAGTWPCATAAPFTFNVTSMGPPIFAASFDSTSTFTLPVGSLSLDLSFVRWTSNRLNS